MDINGRTLTIFDEIQASGLKAYRADEVNFNSIFTAPAGQPLKLQCSDATSLIFTDVPSAFAVHIQSEQNDPILITKPCEIHSKYPFRQIILKPAKNFPDALVTDFTHIQFNEIQQNLLADEIAIGHTTIDAMDIFKASRIPLRYIVGKGIITNGLLLPYKTFWVEMNNWDSTGKKIVGNLCMKGYSKIQIAIACFCGLGDNDVTIQIREVDDSATAFPMQRIDKEIILSTASVAKKGSGATTYAYLETQIENIIANRVNITAIGSGANLTRFAVTAKIIE